MTQKPTPTEEFFGLPAGSLIPTDTKTYRYEPKLKLVMPREIKAVPRPGAYTEECDICGCWPCAHTDPDDFTLE